MINDFFDMPTSDHMITSYQRPSIHVQPQVTHLDYIPTNNMSEYESRFAELVFNFNSINFLDPWSLYLQFTVKVQGRVLQVDSSAHSFISAITFSSNNRIVECITDYDMLQSLLFDATLTREERQKRRPGEGFGVDGTGEIKIGGQVYDLAVVDGDYTVLPATDEYTFRIPIMLNSIGHGIEKLNYKLIPLEIFENIQIKIKFNDNALFGDSDNSYKVSRCYLRTVQYRFTDDVHKRVAAAIKSGTWTLDFIERNVLTQLFFNWSPKISYTATISTKNLKSLLVAFTSVLYKRNHKVRKLSRYNRGVTKIHIKIDGESWPSENAEQYNSLNSWSVNGANYFYQELVKCFGDKGIINLHNFCYDRNSNVTDLSHSLLDINRRTALEQLIAQVPDPATRTALNALLPDNKADELTSRALYAINFETMPYTIGQYKTGLKLDNKTYIIEIDRLLDNPSDHYWRNYFTEDYFTAWFITENYVTWKLDINGQFNII